MDSSEAEMYTLHSCSEAVLLERITQVARDFLDQLGEGQEPYLLIPKRTDETMHRFNEQEGRLELIDDPEACVRVTPASPRFACLWRVLEFLQSMLLSGRYLTLYQRLYVQY